MEYRALVETETSYLVLSPHLALRYNSHRDTNPRHRQTPIQETQTGPEPT